MVNTPYHLLLSTKLIMKHEYVDTASTQLSCKEMLRKFNKKLKQKRLKFPISTVVFQVVLIVLFSKFVDYPIGANATAIRNCDISQAHALTTLQGYSALGFPYKESIKELQPECNYGDEVSVYGSPYQDTQFFIVTGLTLLYVGIQRHSLSTMAITFFLISVCLQWAILCRGLIRLDSRLLPIYPSPEQFVFAIFFVEAVIITWGIILGRASEMQLLVMSIIEIVFAIINDYVILEVLQVSDPSGVLIYNMFGTFFGLAVARMLYVDKQSLHEEKRESSTFTETLAFTGSNILWVFWPTAMGSLFTKEVRYRCIVNTYFVLTGSGVMGTITGAFWDPEGKLSLSAVQNAVLAGGVVMSGLCDKMLGVYAALLIGCLAGTISTLASAYVQPFLETKLHIVDACGSNNLHGVPSLLGGILTAIYSYIATEEVYGSSLYLVFPAMAPKAGTEELSRIQAIWPDVKPGLGRTTSTQALYQIACMIITLTISIISGILTGFLIRQKFFEPLEEEEFYDDSNVFNMPEGALNLQNGGRSQLIIKNSKPDLCTRF